MICWHERFARCPNNHRGELHLFYGRCRSGKHWFWHAGGWNAAVMDDERFCERGWSDSEAQAMEDARAAIIRMAADRPASADIHHDAASYDLKRLNAEKRRARPPSDAKDTPVVEYLYSWSKRFQIIKRTKQRVYYLKDGEEIDERGEPIVFDYVCSVVNDEVGFITRAELEHGRANGFRWLYPSFEPILAERRRHNEHWRQQRAEYLAKHGLTPEKSDDLAALKAEMVAAHPDRGGSSAAFIEARQRYVAARRACRAHA
jgi:hypothetical protein